MMELTTKQQRRITVPFTLGVFENCTLILEQTALGWNGAIEYPERISIRNEYPYIIPAEMLHATKHETTLLFYPSSDMVGGVHDGEPTATLHVRVQHVEPDSVRITLDLDERIQWRSDI